jgi:hypothetical protein
MSRLGITLRDPIKARRQLHVNERAFDRLDETAAYWTGFLMADGGIVGSKVCLHLQTRDKDHLLKFRKFLGAAHRIRKDVNWNTWRLVISSRALVDRLDALGVTPRKSFTAIAPRALESSRHFWRGVIDGDGSLGVDQRQRLVVQLATASPRLLRQYRAFLASRLNRKIAQNGSVQGEDAITVLRVLYDGAVVSLDRKAALYRNILAGASKRTCLSCGATFTAATERYLFCDVWCQRKYPWRSVHASSAS